jgi:hypothetical protein
MSKLLSISAKILEASGPLCCKESFIGLRMLSALEMLISFSLKKPVIPHIF